MEYGKLITDAWSITWRYRFLWVIGIFAGGTAGLSGGGNNGVRWQGDRSDFESLPPEMERFASDAVTWAAANAGLIVGMAILAVMVGLTMLILSFVAQGAMARATADLATGHAITLGQAWHAGLHFFWRYVGLWLVLIGLAIVVAAVVGAVVATAIGLGSVAQVPTWLSIVLAVLLAVPLIVAAIALGIGVSITVAFAQRAIAVEDLGPVAALRSGWTLLRTHLKTSLLVWLINLVLGIAASIVIGLGMLLAVAIFGSVGAVLWATAGLTTPTLAYIGLAIVAVLATGLVLGGVSNTFFWNYWTLAYLRLTQGRTLESASTPAA